jgi:DNA-binding response OmpR family regulator
MMTTSRRILVVAPHADVANPVVGWLTAEGHHASLVTDFVSARPEIDANPPDLLITEVKLGEFNGLQLAICARTHSPSISTIVIGDDDVVLERDAVAQDARYVKKLELSSVFSKTVRAVLS